MVKYREKISAKIEVKGRKIAEKLNLSAAREQVFGGFSEKRAIYLGKCRREGKSRVLHNLRRKSRSFAWLAAQVDIVTYAKCVFNQHKLIL